MTKKNDALSTDKPFNFSPKEFWEKFSELQSKIAGYDIHQFAEIGTPSISPEERKYPFKDFIEITTFGDKNSRDFQAILAGMDAYEGSPAGQEHLAKIALSKAALPPNYRWTIADEKREDKKDDYNYDKAHYFELSKVLDTRKDPKKILVFVVDHNSPEIQRLISKSGGAGALSRAGLVFFDYLAFSRSTGAPVMQADGTKLMGPLTVAGTLGHELQHVLDYRNTLFSDPNKKELSRSCTEAKAVAVERRIMQETTPHSPVRYAYHDAYLLAELNIDKGEVSPRRYVKNRDGIRKALQLNAGCVVEASADPKAAKESLEQRIRQEASEIVLARGITIVPDDTSVSSPQGNKHSNKRTFRK